jgi:8-oxo-dGTP pyrophosphatase MutT (NUDIX family)
MKEYVAGFLYSPDRERVALIRKIKPEWQAGSLNGIGGKVEPGETYEQAMYREWDEETKGTSGIEWYPAVVLQGDDAKGELWRVHFFVAFDDQIDVVESGEEEQVEVINVHEIYSHQVIRNLLWLVPMCCDYDLKLPIQVYER